MLVSQRLIFSAAAVLGGGGGGVELPRLLQHFFCCYGMRLEVSSGVEMLSLILKRLLQLSACTRPNQYIFAKLHGYSFLRATRSNAYVQQDIR